MTSSVAGSVEGSRSSLPVDQAEEAIVEAAFEHRVTLVQGGTGCGKSTCVPQFLARELGGPVVCTQPRRLAAVSIAKRVAEELGAPLGGEEVGYRIGQRARATPHTRIVFATAGVLLQDVLGQGARALLPYKASARGGAGRAAWGPAIVLDEAHERSVGSDLLLAALRELMRGHRKLKLVLMSATCDVQEYCRFLQEVADGRIARIQVNDLGLSLRTVLLSTTVKYLEDVQQLLAGDTSRAASRASRGGGGSSSLPIALAGSKPLAPAPSPAGVAPLARAGSSRLRLQPSASSLSSDEADEAEGEEEGGDEGRAAAAQAAAVARAQEMLDEYHTAPARMERKVKDRELQLVRDLVVALHRRDDDIAHAVLVFLPTYRMLELAHALLEATGLPLVVYALHSSIDLDEAVASMEASDPRRRKVVLATNIAESSLTIPSVYYYVIDSCRTLELRWDRGEQRSDAAVVFASKLQCDQRKGRTGRTCDGVVYRMLPRKVCNTYLPQWEAPVLTLLPLRTQTLNLLCAEGQLAANPQQLLGRAMNPPDPQVVSDALAYLVEIRAAANPPGSTRLLSGPTPPAAAASLQPTPLGRMLGELPVSLEASQLLANGGKLGLLQPAAVLAALLSVSPLPISQPFASAEHHRQNLQRHHAGAAPWDHGSMLITNLLAYEFWQAAFRDPRRLDRLWRLAEGGGGEGGGGGGGPSAEADAEEERAWCAQHNLAAWQPGAPALLGRLARPRLRPGAERGRGADGAPALRSGAGGAADVYPARAMRQLEQLVLAKGATPDSLARSGGLCGGQRPLCRYFQQDSCMRGALCAFSHDLGAALDPDIVVALRQPVTFERLSAPDGYGVAARLPRLLPGSGAGGDVAPGRLLAFWPHDCVLLLGEGDLSFSAALLETGCEATLVPSVLLSSEALAATYPSCATRVPRLASNGAVVVLLFGLDATRLHERLGPAAPGAGAGAGAGGAQVLAPAVAAEPQPLDPAVLPWDVCATTAVVWMHPHTGADNDDAGHHRLLADFFASAAALMLREGFQARVVLTLASDQYQRWAVESAAREALFSLVATEPFRRAAYPGYHLRRGDRDEPFPAEKECTYAFEPRLPPEAAVAGEGRVGAAPYSLPKNAQIAVWRACCEQKQPPAAAREDGWVTAIAPPLDPSSNTLVTSSRDKSVFVWELTREEGNFGYAKRALRGHSHYVQARATAASPAAPPALCSRILPPDGRSLGCWLGAAHASHAVDALAPTLLRVSLHLTTFAPALAWRSRTMLQDVVISSDGQFCLSGSWDGTLRLWDINSGTTTRRFLGHTKDVLSVAFSADNRQIVSGSRDKTIKLWNTLGECKYTIESQPEGHSEWVSCVRFSPVAQNPVIVSAGWDKLVKVWNLTNCKLRNDLKGHQGYVNTVTVSPDGSLCASGGKDGVAMLWDLSEGKRLYSLDAGSIIHSLVFSPNRYWLVAATQTAIKVWDLESKSVVDELRPEFPERSKKAQVRGGDESMGERWRVAGRRAIPYCVSLAWSADGSTLYSGYTDGMLARLLPFGGRKPDEHADSAFTEAPGDTEADVIRAVVVDEELLGAGGEEELGRPDAPDGACGPSLQPSTSGAAQGRLAELLYGFSSTNLETVKLLASGGIAGAVSKSCTAPLARLTILYQVNGLQLAAAGLPGTRLGVWAALRHVVAQEGLRALWKGNGVTIIHRLPYSAANFWTYEQARGGRGAEQLVNELWKRYLPPSSSPTSDLTVMARRLVSGGVAGMTACALAYPLDLVRTRLAAQTQHRCAAWVAPSLAINYATYEAMRSQWLALTDRTTPTVSISLACGSMAGLVSSSCTFPLDLVRRRLQLVGQGGTRQAGSGGTGPQQLRFAAAAGGRGAYGAVFREIWHKEGPRGFYVGILPEYYKVVPGVAIAFCVYEAMKAGLGVTTNARNR
eukprot:scaffold20.g7864.t1